MKILLSVSLLTLSLATFSQPRGDRRPGGSPEEMVAREKQTLYTKVTDLSEDQKLLIDGIYDEFTVTLKETMEELRQSNDRESRREKMEALTEEKDALIADVLNEEQYKIYQSMATSRRERRGQREDSQ
ncbi:hypothetical protein FNH22_27725 [Fulvivirga sp. M361]|uniref:hypothetical protein n=1 Tax=Fulvivirga sp. M361 TaxID=2594266 RepID=UPI00117AECC3|nr:hypothetical protein [Fulvivirga sp. M361]TRX49025.1 hypothetical protein FNH22_27725 [Fulvivirga sp. M361]